MDDVKVGLLLSDCHESNAYCCDHERHSGSQKKKVL